MAKKRVHQIAKERGISSKEVLAVLQDAGLDVKAAASSVDEAEIERAFDAKNGGGEKTAAADSAAAGPATVKDPVKEAPEQAKPAKQSPAEPKKAPARAQRPMRSDGGGAGAAGRRRRVVIDSQASRRQQG
ncbi:MAG: translation initiation factor IF-2 N-terminal domain-containing protein, partial [Gaiellaceae bacterium]